MVVQSWTWFAWFLSVKFSSVSSSIGGGGGGCGLKAFNFRIVRNILLCLLSGDLRGGVRGEHGGGGVGERRGVLQKTVVLKQARPEERRWVHGNEVEVGASDTGPERSNCGA